MGFSLARGIASATMGGAGEPSELEKLGMGILTDNGTKKTSLSDDITTYINLFKTPSVAEVVEPAIITRLKLTLLAGKVFNQPSSPNRYTASNFFDSFVAPSYSFKKKTFLPT